MKNNTTLTSIIPLIIGILIPVIANADNQPKIEVLSIEKVMKTDDDSVARLCLQWELNEKEITDFFFTAKKFITGAEVNLFDIYPCEIEGTLLLNGVNSKYSINLGGSAFIYGKNIQQIGFGCSGGECLKYINYKQYPD
ncbi:hypothetical protein RCS94_06995 [Orbaceae bacterium ac157xtp]